VRAEAGRKSVQPVVAKKGGKTTPPLLTGRLSGGGAGTLLDEGQHEAANNRTTNERIALT
jgi:hypothetical protein